MNLALNNIPQGKNTTVVFRQSVSGDGQPEVAITFDEPPQKIEPDLRQEAARLLVVILHSKQYKTLVAGIQTAADAQQVVALGERLNQCAQFFAVGGNLEKGCASYRAIMADLRIPDPLAAMAPESEVPVAENVLTGDKTITFRRSGDFAAPSQVTVTFDEAVQETGPDLRQESIRLMMAIIDSEQYKTLVHNASTKEDADKVVAINEKLGEGGTAMGLGNFKDACAHYHALMTELKISDPFASDLEPLESFWDLPGAPYV